MPFPPLRLSGAAMLLLTFVAASFGQDSELASSAQRLRTSGLPDDQGPSDPSIAASPRSIPFVEQLAPRTQDYRLGPGDLLSIHLVESADSFREPFRISAGGVLHLPLAGRVTAAGLTVPEFETRLSDSLKTYVRDPHVAVNVVEQRSRPVTVIGAVHRPGQQVLAGNETLLEVLSEAGGLRPDADPMVRVTRQLAWGPLPLANAHPDRSGQFTTAEVDMRDVLDGAGAAGNLLIRPQDIVSVRRAEMVYVVGSVRQSSGFVLEQRRSISVLEALSLAGGLAPKSAPRRAVILRPGEEGARERIQVAVDLKNILAGKDPDLPLESEDVLYVPQSGVKIAAEKAVNAAITIGTGLLIWRR